MIPFFLEQVEGKSLSSILTDGRLHFIRQKKDRRAPEHSLEGPGVMSVFTGRPALKKKINESKYLFNRLDVHEKKENVLLASMRRSRGAVSDDDSCSFTLAMSFGCR